MKLEARVTIMVTSEVQKVRKSCVPNEIRTRVRSLKSRFGVEFRVYSPKIGVIFGDIVSSLLAIEIPKLTRAKNNQSIFQNQEMNIL